MINARFGDYKNHIYTIVLEVKGTLDTLIGLSYIFVFYLEKDNRERLQATLCGKL